MTEKEFLKKWGSYYDPNDKEEIDLSIVMATDLKAYLTKKVQHVIKKRKSMIGERYSKDKNTPISSKEVFAYLIEQLEYTESELLK